MTTGTPAPEAIRTARQAGLRWVNDDEPGLRRSRAGRGLRYLDADARPVRDAKVLARIRILAIPPAWREVWICADDRGHLQATGRDARGRKQYRYHPEWSRVRNTGKFDRIVAFGAALPRLRQVLRRDLRLPALPRDKVLAIVITLMARTLLRIGNDSYARDNGSFGLTTLRNRHLELLEGGRARLCFRAKSGQTREVVLDDARLCRLIGNCRELPGQHLFQYLDETGQRHPVDSGMVNAYLRSAMGGAFTAKDFRTWGASLLAFRLFAATPLPTGRDGRAAPAHATARAEQAVVKAVARALGNTPSVCRRAYIDPVLMQAWRDGSLRHAAADARRPLQWENAALRLLRRRHRARPA